jgi:PadR family transcriptional regulator PadR
MEPFMLVLLAEGSAHGYALVGQLEEMGVATGEQLDFGQVYRTLRDLEEAGLVSSTWSTEPAGPQRREYELTDAGYATLDEWAAVMRERARLMAEFDGRYLSAVARPPRRSRS